MRKLSLFLFSVGVVAIVMTIIGFINAASRSMNGNSIGYIVGSVIGANNRFGLIGRLLHFCMQYRVILLVIGIAGTIAGSAFKKKA